jgi:hypothetical protein
MSTFLPLIRRRRESSGAIRDSLEARSGDGVGRLPGEARSQREPAYDLACPDGKVDSSSTDCVHSAHETNQKRPQRRGRTSRLVCGLALPVGADKLLHRLTEKAQISVVFLSFLFTRLEKEVDT